MNHFRKKVSRKDSLAVSRPIRFATESPIAVRQDLERTATELREFSGWNGFAVDAAALIDTMQDGGEPAMVALTTLLKETFRLTREDQERIRRRLIEYHQLIGRWYIAENRRAFARVPFPAELRP